MCHVTTRIFLLQQGYLCTKLILMLLTLVQCYNQDTFVADACTMLQVKTRILVLLTLVPCHNQDTCVADTCAMPQPGYLRC